MVKIDFNRLGDLLASLRNRRRELDAMQQNLTQPVAVDIDDLIRLIELTNPPKSTLDRYIDATVKGE